jgi:hypothetical protein
MVVVILKMTNKSNLLLPDEGGDKEMLIEAKLQLFCVLNVGHLCKG